MHYYTHNIGDFALATQYLTDEELGIYVRLQDRYLSTEMPLQCEWIAVALRTHCEKAVQNVLSLLFVQQDGAWHNESLDKLIEEYREKSEKAADSARKRWEKAKENQGETQSMRTHSDCNAKAMLTNNHKPITNNQEPIVVVATPRAKMPSGGTSPRTFKLNVETLPDEWREYCEKVRPDLNPETTFVAFRACFTTGSKAGTIRSEKGWNQTWYTWVRNEREQRSSVQQYDERNRPNLFIEELKAEGLL